MAPPDYIWTQEQKDEFNRALAVAFKWGETQVPLDPDISKLLYDNLWDLYA